MKISLTKTLKKGNHARGNKHRDQWSKTSSLTDLRVQDDCTTLWKTKQKKTETTEKCIQS